MTPLEIRTMILSLEDERCRSLVSKDIHSISSLIADDLIHIHANGHVEDKLSYLKTITERLDFLRVTRERLTVRLVGRVAVSSGLLEQQVRVVATGSIVNMRAMVTQIWQQMDGNWKQCLFQATTIS